MRVKQLQLFEKTEKYRFIIRHHQHIGQDIFRQLRTIIHLCTIILQSIIIGVCDGHRGGVLVKHREKGVFNEPISFTETWGNFNRRLFVVDLIGVILVSIVTAYILYRYFLKEVKLHDLFVSVIQSNYVHLLNLFIYKFISQFSNKKNKKRSRSSRRIFLLLSCTV